MKIRVNEFPIILRMFRKVLLLKTVIYMTTRVYYFCLSQLISGKFFKNSESKNCNISVFKFLGLKTVFIFLGLRFWDWNWYRFIWFLEPVSEPFWLPGFLPVFENLKKLKLIQRNCFQKNKNKFIEIYF